LELRKKVFHGEVQVPPILPPKTNSKPPFNGPAIAGFDGPE
jgi:hypothetical protein